MSDFDAAMQVSLHREPPEITLVEKLSISLYPYTFFFHLLVNGICVTSCRTFFRGPLTILILVSGIGGWGGIKIASASNEPAKDLILVHTLHLKPMIKAHFSVRMVCSGISEVAIAPEPSSIFYLC